MTEKHFIALADMVRVHNNLHHGIIGPNRFTDVHLQALADFCISQNPRFNRDRWLGYIAGENGKSGGKVRP